MQVIARQLIPVEIEEEMRSSYLDYSMSVIIGRALPDVRDGLKPVHRRILYAMFDEGLLSNRRYAKCAGTVGEVLKKYHPHGDSAVYDALVRMAQPWNMRYPLVDGQGNFGSVDGDPAAAYRYTESRMSRLAEELLADIDKDTVNFAPNFDGATEEPTVLPAAFPNLLVNGADGIAVGMATKIPPHNLGEIINAVVGLIDNPELTDDELIRIVPGPDFPTAGFIYGRAGIHEAYKTGRGRVIMRGRAEFEEMPGGRWAIIVDELPYQVNKSRLLQEIANLVRQKRIEGISALRDESDRTGMRIVMELKRDAVPQIVLNQLYKHTALQGTFGVILLAIVQSRPVVLTLREMLLHYLDHRRDVVLRRTRYLLRKAEERLHILLGLLIALDNIDEVIKIIRGSRDVDTARTSLIQTFELSAAQAQAILDMQLRRLTGLEREKLEAERDELLRAISSYREILGSEFRLMEVIREELVEIKTRYADPRRTIILDSTSEISIEDLIASEQQVVTLSVNGYIKRTSTAEFQVQRRGGFGKRGMRTRNEDSVKELFLANTHADLLVFTTMGQLYKVEVYKVPESSRDARGTPIVNLVPLEPEDQIASVISIQDWDQEIDLLFCSRKGLVKRTALGGYQNIRNSGLRAYDCADGDRLLTVAKARTDQDVLIVTKGGMSIRIRPYEVEKDENGEERLKLDEEGNPSLQIRHMGRVARGVRGLTLKEGDEIAGMLVLEPDDEARLLTVTENGYGKRTTLDQYRQQNRGGQGIIDIVTDERNGQVAGAVVVHEDDRIMMITDTGRVIKCGVDAIRETSRNTKGVIVMRIDDDERIVSVTRVIEDEDESEGEAGEEGEVGESSEAGSEE